jgi:iron uptake system EfeUOB component EfeO/EfeM
MVDERGCGSGWAGPVAGHQAISVRDAARNPVEVYLIDPAGNLVFAEARGLTPGSSGTMRTSLGPGQYALRCVFSDGPVLTSKAYQVKGTNAGAVPGVSPMPDLALTDPVNAYRAYVESKLPLLLSAAKKLSADVTAGDLRQARADWLPAHLDYERLGAAYNSFDTFDSAINGTDAGLPRGLDDPGWTGFFRIEYGLWHGQPAKRLQPLTSDLVHDIGGLIADFPSEDIDPVNLPLRSHEILENALQFQVSGVDDYGSGTTLATAYANTQGTQEVLSTLTGLIAARQPALLPTVDRWMATVQADLAASHHAGAWIATGRLADRARQRLDGDLGMLLEQLAQIPDLLQERTSA